MRLVVPGGRARETAEASGSVAVGMRTLSEGGTVGTFAREQACYCHRFPESLLLKENFGLS